MSNPSPDARELSARLDRIERRSRFLIRSVIAAALILASTGLVTGQRQAPDDPESIIGGFSEIGPDSDVVQQRVVSREFMLVDGDGNHRASLVADNAGSVFLTLLDEESTLRASLSVMNRGPALTYYDPDGQVRAVLGSTTLVASHVEGADGNLERNTPSSIVLFDGEGNLLWREP